MASSTRPCLERSSMSASRHPDDTLPKGRVYLRFVAPLRHAHELDRTRPLLEARWYFVASDDLGNELGDADRAAILEVRRDDLHPDREAGGGAPDRSHHRRLVRHVRDHQ